MYWYVIISLVFLVLSIWVMIDVDSDNSQYFYPPEMGYNFKDNEGKFKISKIAWITMFCFAPFTNLIGLPGLLLFALFCLFRKKE